MTDKVEVSLIKPHSCVAGQISWKRLEGVLRRAGEIKHNEYITNLKADEWGI